MKNLRGLWIPTEVLLDKKLNDKEKITYSMIIALSNTNECTMSNGYISNLLNICDVQASRIVNSLKKKGYVRIELIHKENSKEIAFRKIVPINKNVNTYKQISAEPITKNVKDIKYNNKIGYKRKNFEERDYSNFNWEQFYANI